jgi:alpha-1,6-mannosyltransferase
MVIRGAALSLAYVPGRAIDMGPALDFTATRMRDTVSPIIQMAMLLAVILWWRQPDRPELFPFKKPKAPPAESSPTDSGPRAAPRKVPPRSSPPKAARAQAVAPVKEPA